jgi:uncharacterized protein (DUF427 family)
MRRESQEKIESMKATWNGAMIAQSDDTEVVEGNHYFPAAVVERKYLKESSTHTVCPWKGTASYYSLVVDGKENPDAVWYYPDPKPAAKQIKDRVAFWHGVEVKP